MLLSTQSSVTVSMLCTSAGVTGWCLDRQRDEGFVPFQAVVLISVAGYLNSHRRQA